MAQANKTQISIRTPDDLIKAFDEVASILDRDRTWVMLRAFRLYLASEGRDILQEAAGLASLDRGEGIAMDKVMEKMNKLINQPASRKVS